MVATAMDGALENVASDDEFQSPSNSPPPVVSSDIKVSKYLHVLTYQLY